MTSVRRATPNSSTETPWEQILFFIEGPLLWLSLNWLWLVTLFAITALTILVLRALKRKHEEIQKLWIFTLFFLTKRQMMLPLVISLSRKDKILDKATQKKLMEIREKCRKVSFKKSPTARLTLEKEVSHILYDYFSTLEAKKQIKAGTKFEKIVQDLEFIDAKLVQLQQVYNAEVTQWNRRIRFGLIQMLIKPFGIKTFEPFN